MKAYKLYGIDDLRYEDCGLPILQDGWALVQVRACGICSSDIPRIFTKGTYRFPTVPGHEFSGVVVKVANMKDIHWINKRVSVYPLIPCKQCEFCVQKHYEICVDYDYLGSRRDGGFAEYVAVPVWNLVEISDNTDFVEGALFEPFAVALHAVNQANLNGGESMAVVGVGAIAFAITQWAKVKGVKKICIIGRNNKKKYIADKYGIDFMTSTAIKGKFDTVIEAVGSSEAISTAINITKCGGTMVLMGNPNSDITLTQNIYWQVLRHQLSIIGTWNSSYNGLEKSEWLCVRNAFDSKIINGNYLVTQVFNQTKLKDALLLMKQHKDPYCKVMTVWNESEDNL